LASYFLQAKAMQNNFRVFEELVFLYLWIPDSGFWFPVSGFRFPGFRVALRIPASVLILFVIGL